MSGFLKKLLILPHIKVHNANALSSPYTIGFPAMTAWLGAAHALQRKLIQKGQDVSFSGVGVVCHDINLQTYKGENDYVRSIIGTGNPLDKEGNRSSFIEEARCHLDITLVIEYPTLTVDEQETLLEQVGGCLHGSMKLAGGDIQSFDSPYCLTCDEGDDSAMAKFKRSLMPGHVLIERRELMAEAMKHSADAMEALIDYLAIHHTCEVSAGEDQVEQVQWHAHRKQANGKSAGWLVPIATGFQGISPLAEAKNQRDPDTPHRFAESLVTLGEFKMAHRLINIEQMLWRYAIDGDLYLCYQNSHKHLLATPVLADEDDSEY